MLGSDVDLDDNIGIAARGEAAQSGDAAPMRAGSFLKPSSDANNVVQESKDIQQVGFAGCVGPHQKNTVLQVHIHLGEIPPVFKTEPSKGQCARSRIFHEDCIPPSR